MRQSSLEGWTLVATMCGCLVGLPGGYEELRTERRHNNGVAFHPSLILLETPEQREVKMELLIYPFRRGTKGKVQSLKETSLPFGEVEPSSIHEVHFNLKKMKFRNLLEK